MYLGRKTDNNNAEEAGYWRKANAIHTWFVHNVQNGVDDCNQYQVSRDKIKELLDTVDQVLNSTKLIPGKIVNGYSFQDGKKISNIQDGKILDDTEVARKLLPSQSGFFFGNTDYNEYYWQDLLDTKDILTKALENKNGNYYYQSSW